MGQNVSFDELYHRCFNITSIRNSPHLFVLPSHPITHPHFSLKYEAFNIQCDDIFSSVFIPIHILSYQPSCYSCLHLATPYSYQYISCLISRPVTAVYSSKLSYTLWPQTFCFSDVNKICRAIDRTSTFAL